MWHNYIIVGARNALRDPVSSAINLIGLTIGIAGCLIIIMFIRHQLSFDGWIPGAERAYQLQREFTAGTDQGKRSAQSPYVAATALAPQFPEFEAVTGVVWTNGVVRKDGAPLSLSPSYATDADFFEVLPLPLLHGDPETALASANSVVLTEESALKLFGRTDVLGRTVTRIGDEKDIDFRVTGVLRDIPDNSHLRVGALYRATPEEVAGENFTRWSWISGWVYVRLRPGADVEAIHARMDDALERVVPASDQDPAAADGIGFTHRLINIRDVNTSDTAMHWMRPGTSMKTLVTFGIVAAFLMLVACVNFTNLATARASRRAREVGLRKTLGARRRQLIAQFMTESLLTAGAAALIAVALVELIVPYLEDHVGGRLTIDYLGANGILLPAVALALGVGLLAGLYPAFYLSRYRPAAVLKANQSSAETPGTGRLRTALVVVQFAVSIALIICTAIIYAQGLYARSADPGFKASGSLFVFNAPSIGERPQIETFMRRVDAIPGVTSVSRIAVAPNSPTSSTRTFSLPGSTDMVSLQIIGIDGETFETLGMELLAGRGVSDEREADVGAPLYNVDPEADERIARRGLNVVIDERAVDVLGFDSAQDAIGRQIAPLGDENEAVAPATVVGVVNHIRLESMRLESLPKLYFITPSGHIALAVRFEDVDGAAVNSAIESLWKSAVPDSPFNASFGDERIAEMYEGDARRGQLFAVFAGLAVLISCLGLFGLAAFTAERRTKEIGIRKVLGARTSDIVRLLVWQFTRPVIVANLIAWPVAWWAMRDWLNGFSDRIALGPWPFVAAGLLALAIAAGTIVGHAVKVARANPIHALRYE